MRSAPPIGKRKYNVINGEEKRQTNSGSDEMAVGGGLNEQIGTEEIIGSRLVRMT